LVAILAPSVARAAAIFIDDTSPDETITVSANDFEFGLFVNGGLVQQGLNNPASAKFPETGAIAIHGTWIDNSFNQPQTRTIYLLEPGDPATAPLVSDIFNYRINPNGNGTASIDGDFISDFEGPLGPLPAGVDPHDVFFEDGRPVSFDAAFLTGQLISDIPEPGSIVLLATGLSALALVAWRRKRS
jgi:hypothetical protein